MYKRQGYGQPLGDVDKLQEGDPIIVRTKDYWYVYHYTRYEIVLPTDVHVIAPNPEDSTANPTKRMITLTTCEPKYSTPTHRWISYGELAYWAKAVSYTHLDVYKRQVHGTPYGVVSRYSSSLP